MPWPELNSTKEKVSEDNTRYVFTTQLVTDIHDENDVGPGSVAVVRPGTRPVQITSILPLSRRTATGEMEPHPFYIDMEAGAFLALQHFNSRNGAVMPSLPSLLEDCDMRLSLDARDSQFSEIVASTHLSQALLDPTAGKPAAILGAVRSAVSKPLSILAGTFAVPQISPLSTSKSLDLRGIYPYFGRVIPTNAGDAQALVEYYDSLGVHHFAVTYIRDEYGNNFVSDILRNANQRNMKVVTAPYDAGVDSSIKDAMGKLQLSGMKYIFAIMNGRDLPIMFRQAYRLGIAGNSEYSWMCADGAVEYTQEGFSLDKEDEELARAINGIGVLIVDSPPNPGLEFAMQAYTTDEQLRQDFVAAHKVQDIFEMFDYSERPPAVVQLTQLYYDAMISIGLAACDVQDHNITGPQLYDSFRKLNFQGSSGPVFFDQETGTRAVESMYFTITNVVRDNPTDSSDRIHFKSTKSMLVDFRQAKEGRIQNISPFLFADGTPIPPQPYPPLEVDMNLIPNGVLVTGLVFCACCLFLSMLCAAFTYFYRRKASVKTAQPEFLIMTCVGTLLLGLSIIPMSLQEPTPNLSAACMSTMWLFSFGFVTSFSALFCKMHRLNKLRKKAARFKRVTVTAKDVLYPFMVLMGLNAVVLVVWTFVDPLTWLREPLEGIDQFGRPTATMGHCSTQNKRNGLIFYTLFFSINVFAVAFSLYESYAARNTNFSEGFSIALSMLIMGEGMVLGFPVMFLVSTSPPANFLVRSSLVTIICLAILLPTFVPKYLARNQRHRSKPSKHVPFFPDSLAGGSSPRRYSTSFDTDSNLFSKLESSHRPCYNFDQMCNSRQMFYGNQTMDQTYNSRQTSYGNQSVDLTCNSRQTSYGNQTGRLSFAGDESNNTGESRTLRSIPYAVPQNSSSQMRRTIKSVRFGGVRDSAEFDEMPSLPKLPQRL